MGIKSGFFKCVWAHVRVCTFLEAEADEGGLPQSLSIFYIEARCLAEPGAHYFGSSGYPDCSFQKLSVATPLLYYNHRQVSALSPHRAIYNFIYLFLIFILKIGTQYVI